MPRLFKRSAKVPIAICHQNDNNYNDSDEISTYRARSDQQLDIINENRLIENESKAERSLTGQTSSVSGRLSNFVSELFGKMGRNRRSKTGKSIITVQPAIQTHMKKIHSQNDKQQQQQQQQQQTGKNNNNVNRQSNQPFKKPQTDLYSNELTSENNKFSAVSYDVNSVKCENKNKKPFALNVGDQNDRMTKMNRNNKDNKRMHTKESQPSEHQFEQPEQQEQHQSPQIGDKCDVIVVDSCANQNVKNFHFDTFGINDTKHVICFVDGQSSASTEIKFAHDYNSTTVGTHVNDQIDYPNRQTKCHAKNNNDNNNHNNNNNDDDEERINIDFVNGNDDVNEFKIENKMFHCSSSNGEDKNSSVAKTTTDPTPYSCTKIELCTSITDGKNNFNKNVCEQLRIQSENHNASSSRDCNNNEINIKNVGNERSNAIVNCDDSGNRPTAQSTFVGVGLTEKSLPFGRQNDKKAGGSLNSDKSKFDQTFIGPAMGQHQSASSNSKQTKQKSKKVVQNQQKNSNNNETNSSSISNSNLKSVQNANGSTTVASNKQQHEHQQKQQGIQQTTIKTKENASQRDIWHDAPSQTQFYDKNKINFSNEFNEKLETETSLKQARIDVESDSVAETVAVASDRTANETKDIFYETTSDINDERVLVGTSQCTGTDTKNVNGNNLIRSETVSNGEINCRRIDIETGSPQPNDTNDVTSATDYISTKQLNLDGVNSHFETNLNQPKTVEEPNENNNKNVADDRLKKNVSTFETTANVKIHQNKVELEKNSENIKCGGGESNCEQKREQNCEQQPTKQQLNDDTQMEQNVLYRVDSYNSDDALELSDIEETVINEHGKVVEVKTIFKQRSSAKKPNDSQSKSKSKSKSISNDPLKHGLRTIGNRRRSNSISGSLDIEIVEYGLDTSNTNNEQLSKQPVIFLADDDRDAIKLADLTDNSIGNESKNHAVNVVEIVQEDECCESGSDDEHTEIEEEEEEEEEDEEKDDDKDVEKEEIENEKKENVHLTNQKNVNHSTSTPATTKTTLTTPSYDDSDNVIRVLVNGQPTQFKAPNHINLTNRIDRNSQHSVIEIEKSQNVTEHKHINNSNSNLNISDSYNSEMKHKPSDQMQLKQQHPSKYLDDAMHLPDIVVGSTLNNNSNGNLHINKKTIPLSRSPPKIVVNDTTTWSSGTDETETISETYEELSEEEESEISQDPDSDKPSDSNKLNANQMESAQKQNNNKSESKKHELHLLAQIDEANRNVTDAQFRISELTNTIADLERQLTVKTWNVERLQAELDAAYKELNCVKSKLKLQEAELDASRVKYCDKEDDHNLRYNNLEADHLDLKQKLDRMQSLAISLQVQLNQAQSDLTDLRAEKERFERERNDEREALQDALDAAIIERGENDAKWQREYEQLRTLNSDREELLLQDCEWKIRSTERACKDRITAAERAKSEAIAKSEKISSEADSQSEKLKHFKTYEAEVAALRGLTNEQRQSIGFLTHQLEDIKTRLDESTRQLDDSMSKIRKMAVKFASDLSDKDRETIARIDQVRGEVASMWEDRLLNEMLRLKIELETCHAEDRVEAVRRAQEEHIADVNQLKENFAFREQMLRDEIDAVKSQLTDRNRRLDEANDKADKQIMQIRMILNKSERDHQREINAQIVQHENEIYQLKQDFDERENRMKNEFERKIDEIKKRYDDDLSTNRAEMIAKVKREYEAQYEKFKAEKEEEQQDMQRMYKRKLVDADVKIRDNEILHEREIKDLQNAHSMERSTLEKRDLHNSEEIETLHRKCRCLTKLFEEMRIRYERRDPRPEDMREIQELKGIIDAQDKDLCQLTERLRGIQIHHAYDNNVVDNDQSNVSARKIKKPILNCDVIYEAENEDEESHAIAV